MAPGSLRSLRGPRRTRVRRFATRHWGGGCTLAVSQRGTGALGTRVALPTRTVTFPWNFGATFHLLADCDQVWSQLTGRRCARSGGHAGLLRFVCRGGWGVDSLADCDQVWSQLGVARCVARCRPSKRSALSRSDLLPRSPCHVNQPNNPQAPLPSEALSRAAISRPGAPVMLTSPTTPKRPSQAKRSLAQRSSAPEPLPR
jgi:hypothetical protein